MIFDIQRYSVHDGPGIRTVVFLKGCSLECRWCQNPESRSRCRQLLYDVRRCLPQCNLCQRVAPGIIEMTPEGLKIDRERGLPEHMDALENCCPSRALVVCGERRDVSEIMAVIRRDKPFYDQSGGGVTLSGGEPFLHPQLAEQLFRQSEAEGIHTAVETCLHVPWQYITPSLPYVRLFLADLKHVDEKIFKEWTGGSAKRVLVNMQHLASLGKHVIVRVPLIPGFNTSRGAIRSIVAFTADLAGVEEIHFLPYHTLGKNKYALLNQPYYAPEKPLELPEVVSFARTCAEQKGLKVTLRG